MEMVIKIVPIVIDVANCQFEMPVSKFVRIDYIPEELVPDGWVRISEEEAKVVLFDSILSLPSMYPNNVDARLLADRLKRSLKSRGFGCVNFWEYYQDYSDLDCVASEKDNTYDWDACYLPTLQLEKCELEPIGKILFIIGVHVGLDVRSDYKYHIFLADESYKDFRFSDLFWDDNFRLEVSVHVELPDGDGFGFYSCDGYTLYEICDCDADKELARWLDRVMGRRYLTFSDDVEIEVELEPEEESELVQLLDQRCEFCNPCKKRKQEVIQNGSQSNSEEGSGELGG
jgi:hypothetical protein